MPKEMHPEFGAIVKAECDRTGKELGADEVYALFEKEYLSVNAPYQLGKYKIDENAEEHEHDDTLSHFTGTILKNGAPIAVEGSGNGPIDAFFSALAHMGLSGFKFLSYHEHAISIGSDSKAAAYIALEQPDGSPIFGVGISGNITRASMRGILCAINRSLKNQE